jgi:hypothetical protein
MTVPELLWHTIYRGPWLLSIACLKHFQLNSESRFSQGSYGDCFCLPDDMLLYGSPFQSLGV